MAKARKRAPRPDAGDAASTSFADLLRRNARALAEDDILPPIPPNRATETFQTVGEDLTRQMGQNPRDPAKTVNLRNLTESMLTVIDESRRVPPDEAEAFAEVVNAYAQAYRNQTPEQRAVLQTLAGTRAAELDAFFNPVEQKPLPFMQPAPSDQTPGLRAARAAAIDRRADEDEFLAGNLQGMGMPLASPIPYERSTRGRRQDSILGALIDDYGLDPEDVMDATLADAALPVYERPPGVYTSRDQYPTPEKLATYMGRDKAADLRYESVPNPSRIGEELLSQHRAITRRGLEPRLGPFLGSVGKAPPDMLMASINPNVADYPVAIQMRPQIEKVQQELYHRAFGYPTVTDRMDSIADMRRLDDLRQVEQMMDLDAIAPWWRGTTQQLADGQIVDSRFTPEQVTDTIISQSGFLAEQPYLRKAARERLLPQVAYAMQNAQAVPPADHYRATKEFNARYRRNPEGIRLLEEALGRPVERPVESPPRPAQVPPSTGAAEILERMRRASRKLSPDSGDVGFARPAILPRLAGETMPNRMLAALLT